jgi:large subunit ribosomal protein L25
MSEILDTFKATSREPAGKSGARKLRLAGQAPAIAYGKGREPVYFSIDPKEFAKSRLHYGLSHLYFIDIEGGEKIPALIQDVQVDAFRNKLLHVDFWSVDVNTPVSLSVPLEFTGRPQGVVKGGTFRGLRRAVMLTGLPGKIPDSLTIETSHLDLSDSICLENLDLPEGVTPTADDNHAVAMVVAPKAGRVKAEEDK